MEQFDVLIIGAGVTGAAVAHALGRYALKVGVIDKEEDVCCGTTKANSAIVHAGFDAAPGTLMAEMNVRGNAMMRELAETLDFPFRRNGSLVLCLSEEDRPALMKLYEQGIQNGVPGLEIVEREALKAMEPNVSDAAVCALYAPTGGIVDPFKLNIALAENACQNGTAFIFDAPVTAIDKTENGYRLTTPKGEFAARVVVNAAGVYADEISRMVSARAMKIIPRSGEYYLLDKSAGSHVKHTVFTLPGKYGKGVLVTPTVHGNLLVGPTATDLDDKEATQTTAAGLADALQKAGASVKDLPMRQVITTFTGLRAHEEKHEFIIEEAEDAPGFIQCAGIESPGLTSAPAIGERAAQIVCRRLAPALREQYIERRKDIVRPQELTMEERNALIAENPAYGRIICRCELVTEGEIVEAIRRTPGARSLDGVKRRTRAGMGRCQAGFCSPRTMEILARELGIPLTDVTKCGGASRIAVGTDKDEL